MYGKVLVLDDAATCVSLFVMASGYQESYADGKDFVRRSQLSMMEFSIVRFSCGCLEKVL